LAAALRVSRACGLATGALLQSGAECAPALLNGALHLSCAPGLGAAARGAALRGAEVRGEAGGG